MKITLDNLIEQRNSLKQLKEKLTKDLVTHKNRLNGLINRIASSQDSVVVDFAKLIKKSEDEVDKIFLDQSSNDFDDMLKSLQPEITVIYQDEDYFTEPGFTPSYTYTSILKLKTNYFYLKWDADLDYRYCDECYDNPDYILTDYELKIITKDSANEILALREHIDSLKKEEIKVSSDYYAAIKDIEQLLTNYDNDLLDNAWVKFKTTIQTGENKAVESVFNYVLKNKINYKFYSYYINNAYKASSIQSTDELSTYELESTSLNFSLYGISIRLTTDHIYLHASICKRYKLISAFEANTLLAIKKSIIEEASSRRHANALATALSMGGLQFNLPKNTVSDYAKELDFKWGKYFNTNFQDIEIFTDYKLERE